MEYETILKTNVEDFIIERINDNYNNLIKNARYLKEEKECGKLAEKLTKEFNIELFEKYKNQNNNLQYLELQESYKKGFKDCIYIMFNKNN